MSWFGLGKKRSRLGKFLDSEGISQKEFQEASGLSSETTTRLCNESDANPQKKTATKAIRGIKKLTGKEMSVRDFWT